MLTSGEQLRRVIEQSFERLNGKKVENITVHQWLERWLKGEAGAVADTTYGKYKQVLGAFLSFLGTRANVRLETITTEDFTRYRDRLLKEGRTPRTVNITVRKILTRPTRPFTAAVTEGLIQRNPISSIRHLRDVTVAALLGS